MGHSQILFLEADQTIESMRASFDVKWAFAVVRNPWDRLVSMYTYMMGIYQRGESDHTVEDFRNLLIRADGSYNSFLEFLQVFSNMPYSPSIITARSPMSDYLRGGVDLVIRYENLNAEFAPLQKMFNCYTPLPRLRSSVHNNYSSYYDTQTKDLVAKLFTEDIDTWEYTF
jgi:hypothetical protein